MLREDSNLEGLRARRLSCPVSECSMSTQDEHQAECDRHSAARLARIKNAAVSGSAKELGDVAAAAWGDLRPNDGMLGGRLASVSELRPVVWQEEPELLVLIKTCAATAELMTYKLLQQILLIRHEHLHWRGMRLYPWRCILQRGPAICWNELASWVTGSAGAARNTPMEAARNTATRLKALESPVAAAIGRLNHLLSRLRRLDDAPPAMIRNQVAVMAQQLRAIVKSRTAWRGHHCALLEPAIEDLGSLSSLTPKTMHLELYKVLQGAISGLDAFVEHLELCRHDKAHMQRMPSHFERCWYRYAAGAWCVLSSGVWIWSHSGYNNSEDLGKWREKAADNWRLFVTEHLQEPLTHIYNEVFGGEYQTVSDPKTVAESRRYLSQMLFDFGRLHLQVPDGATDKIHELRAQSEAGDMTIVMDQYIADVQRPLIGAVSGYLPQMLLIQVQKLKLDVEQEMLGIEKLMRENELNLQLMATVPACMLLYGTYKSVFWTISSILHRYRRRNQRSLTEIAASLQQLEGMLNCATGHCRAHNSLEDYMQMSHSEHGQVLGYVFELELSAVFIHPRAERQKFVDSLALFKNPSYPPAQLLRACDHMYAQYPFLQQKPESTFW